MQTSQLLCEWTVMRFMTPFQQTGDIKPKSYRHGPPKLILDHEQLMLLRLILSYPGIYLPGKTNSNTRSWVTISTATICHTIKFMGCTRQVLQHIALPQDKEQRARFMAKVSMYDPSMVLWTDESGCDRCHSIRKCAYAIRGKPPRDHKILICGFCYSSVPIMSLEGVHDYLKVLRMEKILKSSLGAAFCQSCNHSVVSTHLQ